MRRNLRILFGVIFTAVLVYAVCSLWFAIASHADQTIQFPPRYEGDYTWQCGRPIPDGDESLYLRFPPGGTWTIPDGWTRWICNGTIECRVTYNDGRPSEPWVPIIVVPTGRCP